MTLGDKTTDQSVEPHHVIRFLDQAGWPARAVTPCPGDASSRRYFRVHTPLTHARQDAMVMDASLCPEVIAPFIKVTDFLRTHGLSAPEIWLVDQDQGLLVCEDFGSVSFIQSLAYQKADGDCAGGQIYDTLVDALCHLHTAPPISASRTLGDRLEEELDRFLIFYLPFAFALAQKELDKPALAQKELDKPAQKQGGNQSKDHKIPLSDEARAVFHRFWTRSLSESLSQPPVTVLLDVIHANLFWLPHRDGVRRIGFIDVQDALPGPAVYDLASFVFDIRHPVPASVQAHMIARFAAQTGRSNTDVTHQVALWSVQRNLRILGTFVRLAEVYHKPAYLAYLPQIWVQIGCVIDMPVFEPLRIWLDHHLPFWRAYVAPEGSLH